MREGLEWSLLGAEENEKVEKLMKIYRENPKHARIVYFNDKKDYTKKRLVLFEDTKTGDFEISEFVKTFGVSITNRMYSSEYKSRSVIYKKGLFWVSLKEGKRRSIAQLTYQGLVNFSAHWTKHGTVIEYPIIHTIFNKCSWVRFVSENQCLHHTALNTFIRNKLYNRNDALRFLFKAPLPVILLLVEHVRKRNGDKVLKVWRELKKVLKNTENLKVEMLKSHLFMDACRMAMVVDKKVNCSWSLKRLKAEHDAWAREMTDVLFDTTEEEILKIRKEFADFGERYGYKLLKTNKELFKEGLIQRHCVGGYTFSINRGTSGIYHHSGYTLELNFDKQKTGHTYINDTIAAETLPSHLSFGQMRGYLNQEAPAEMINLVQGQIAEFNADYFRKQEEEKERRRIESLGLELEQEAVEKAEVDYAEKGNGQTCVEADDNYWIGNAIMDRQEHRVDWLTSDIFIEYGEELPPELQMANGPNNNDDEAYAVVATGMAVEAEEDCF